MIYTILLLAIALRLISLNQSLWLDEATSLVVVRDLSWSQLFKEFLVNDFHPPLYYVLLKLWTAIFGFSEISARSLSVLMGTATVYLTYLIGKSINSKTGTVSALLLAVSPLHIYYSQEARMYVPVAFFVVLSLYFLTNILSSKKGWIPFILSTLAVIYTDYMPVFLFFALFLYLLIWEKGHIKENKKQWITILGLILLGFLPWVPTFIKQITGGLSVQSTAPGWWQVLGKTNIKLILLVPVKFMLGRISFLNKLLYAGVVGSLGILYTVPIFIAFLKWQKTKLLFLLFLGTLFISAILGIYIPLFSYFRFVFLLPIFYLILSFGITTIKHPQIKVILVTLFCIAELTASFYYLLNPRFHRENWKEAVSWIEASSQDKSGTLFVTDGQRDPYYYYSQGKVPSFGPDDINYEYNTIWLMRYVQPIFDPEDKVRMKVEELGYTKVEEKDFNGVTVWKYNKN